MNDTIIVKVEKVYRPEAIVQYLHRNARQEPPDLTLEAKKHLAALGWVFWYPKTIGKKKNLRISSPAGNCYFSLREACEACIGQVNNSCIDFSTRRGRKRKQYQYSDKDSGERGDDQGKSLNEPRRGKVVKNLNEPRRETVIENQNEPRRVKNLNEPRRGKVVKNLNEPRKETVIENLNEPRRGKVVKNLNEPRRGKVVKNLNEPRRETVIENLNEPRRETVIENLNEPRRGKVVKNLNEPRRGKVVKNLNEPRRETVIENLNEPRRGKVVKNLNEPRRGKVVKNLNEPRRETVIENLNEPRRGKVVKNLNEPRTSRFEQETTPSSWRRKPKTVLSTLIDNRVVRIGDKVHYRGTSGCKNPSAEGEISREGIKCSCCSKVFTLTGFESHTGNTNHRPAANILLEDGRSLSDCQAQLTAKKKTETHEEIHRTATKRIKTRSDNKKDSICSICLFEGELILCDRCPAAFHQSCINDFSGFSNGNWFCPLCICEICNQPMSEENDYRAISCDYCQTKYHNCCGQKTGKWFNLSWFCSTRCQEIFLSIDNILGKPIHVEDKNLTWTLLKSIESHHFSNHLPDIEELRKNQQKLELALDVMHECFEKTKDVYTGRDVAEEVIFSRGSELNRANFKGFCVAVVENEDDMVCAATVRIHGDVAEIPLVATRFRYQRRGMCRVLMKELEKQLWGIGVKRLILPALVEAVDTWVNYFGYSKMIESEKLAVLDQRFLNFPGTVICQKFLKDIISANPLEKTRENRQHHNKVDDFDWCSFKNGSYPPKAMEREVKNQTPILV